MTPPLLEAHGLELSFGGVRALDGLSLAITDEHHLWGLIGPNGSGKSSLFNVVSGLYRPQSGTVTGTAVSGGRRSPTRLGRTFQHPRVFPSLTVAENLLAVSSGMSRKAAQTRATELLGLLGLPAHVDRRAGELSIGQQKLVELARALMQSPGLVLLDEVAAGINPRLRDDIAEHLRALASHGTRFLIIEHDMDFLMGLCSRVFCMARGRLIAEGTPVEIQQNDAVAEQYLGPTHD